MRSKANQDVLKPNEEVVPGVFVEILWDIEIVREEGRRRGERIVESVWWRAQVLSVRNVDGKYKVRLRYDGQDGFEEQDGEVWLFPRHVRPVEDDSTQLRWRYYECSGDVEYDMEEERVVDYCEQTDGRSSDLSSQRPKAVEDKLSDVLQRYETLERLVSSQNTIFRSLAGTGSSGDRACARLFANIRQKVAILMQKPVPPLKMRKECHDSSAFYEDSSAGCMSIDVDCDFEMFQAVARVLKSKFATPCFRPCFMRTQFPDPSLDEFEIVFSSFSDLMNAIGVTSTSDVMRMTVRERGRCKDHERQALDVAVRIVGTCVTDAREENSPAALLICKSIHEGSLDDPVDSLIRNNREFDFKSRAYRNPLEVRACTGNSVLRSVFGTKLVEVPETRQVHEIKLMASELRNFTVRWRAIPSPNHRIWSRSLAVCEFSSGILEVEIPFLVFRGPDSVSEILQVVDDTFILRKLGDDHSFEEGVAVSRGQK